MKIFTLAAAAVLTVAALTPAVAQPAAGSPPASRMSRARTGGPGQNGLPGPGMTGGQSGAYVRRPSSLTPTDVGNMAFPDPSLTPAGNLPAVAVGR